MNKIKVLFIAGWGRSGSTILNNLLGQIPGFFSVGELLHIWTYGYLENGICGCNQPILDCKIWRAILSQAYGSETLIDPHAMIACYEQFIRTRNLPSSIRSSSPQPSQECLKKVEDLYLAIKQETNCDVIVDSSKHPMYGFLLNLLPSLDVYTLHLVRDPRAVAFSWKRKKYMPDTQNYFRQTSASETSIMWSVWNIGIQLLNKNKPDKYIRVRYEDFVSQPQHTFSRILDALSLETRELPFDLQQAIQLKPTHSIKGNPIRLNQEPVKLRIDNEWTTKMKLFDRFIVSLLTWVPRSKYQY